MSENGGASDLRPYQPIATKIDGSSFSGSLTRVEIGHIRMGSAGRATERTLKL
jgi:hypothetical protein